MNCENIFDECQPTWSQYLNIMDIQTTSTLCIALHGKNNDKQTFQIATDKVWEDQSLY